MVAAPWKSIAACCFLDAISLLLKSYTASLASGRGCKLYPCIVYGVSSSCDIIAYYDRTPNTLFQTPFDLHSVAFQLTCA